MEPVVVRALGALTGVVVSQLKEIEKDRKDF
jgi:hypothetical protein